MLTGASCGDTYTLIYDYENRLVEIQDDEEETIREYAYDGLGRRVSRAVGGGTPTVFYYDGSKVLHEKVGGNWQCTCLYGNGLIRRGTTEYPLYDDQGNVRQVTRGNETVAATFVYDGFGNVTSSSGSTNLKNKYVGNLGYRDDGDLGLMHVGARYYDPDVGRFITRDPVLSEHPYVYCGADPVNGLDPDGLCCLRQAGRASGVLEGSLGGLVLELGSCITDKLCVDACTRTGIPQGPCRKLCASFRGSTCAALWRYCEHLGRHRGGKTYAEICLAVHDTLCSGE